jgi:hypothetical protein
MTVPRKRRLSSIELLPPEADEALAWAVSVIRQRCMAQVAITRELNRRLAALGLGPVSNSSLNRFVARLDAGEAMPRLQASPAVLAEPLRSALVTLIDERIALALGRPARDFRELKSDG